MCLGFFQGTFSLCSAHFFFLKELESKTLDFSLKKKKTDQFIIKLDGDNSNSQQKMVSLMCSSNGHYPRMSGLLLQFMQNKDDELFHIS